MGTWTVAAWAFPLLLAGGVQTPVEPAWQRATACMARQMDGAVFRDPYLRYVYPGETLPSSADGSPLTYRIVDGDLVLSLLGRAGELPGSLAPAAAHAQRALVEAAPRWRGAGFNNTRRAPRSDGVALDTFCMVGWLAQDAIMAREVAAALEQDRWLPDRWYEGDQAFRALADECWCARLLLSNRIEDPSGEQRRAALRVVSRWSARFLAANSSQLVDTGRFYEAWHLGMVLAELGPRRWSASDRTLADAALGTMQRWADDHGRAEGDALEWANLASSELLPLMGSPGRRLRQRAVDVLVARQDGDGCWESGFVTLRALLALQLYRNEGLSRSDRKPAP